MTKPTCFRNSKVPCCNPKIEDQQTQQWGIAEHPSELVVKSLVRIADKFRPLIRNRKMHGSSTHCWMPTTGWIRSENRRSRHRSERQITRRKPTASFYDSCKELTVAAITTGQSEPIVCLTCQASSVGNVSNKITRGATRDRTCPVSCRPTKDENMFRIRLAAAPTDFLILIGQTNDVVAETAELRNPGLPGNEQFETVIYGSPPLGYPAALSQYVIYNTPDPAYVTGRINVSAFANLGAATPWPFTNTNVPLNGHVCIPRGRGPFPLAVFAHGNHSPFENSTPGYLYLCQFLASMGSSRRRLRQLSQRVQFRRERRASRRSS